VTDPVTVAQKKLIFSKNVKTLVKVNLSGHPYSGSRFRVQGSEVGMVST
jgi:hypothetical protein